MKYAIISGSHRDDSVAQSYKIAKWLAEALSSKSADAETDIISLGGNPYPLWDQSAWDGGSGLAQQMKPVLERITQADAIILIAPEWGGMVPGGLKNFLIYVSSAHAAHKPALLVGVSGSRGGTYPIAELRMSGYKNSRMVYIPDHLIVTSAEKVMNDHDLENGDAADVYIKNRAHYSLDVLAAYAKALKGMREAGNLLDESYPFGMQQKLHRISVILLGMQIVLTPEILLAAYSQGLFPMAHGARSNYVHWVCPELRGQISITGMHVPRRLRKSVRHMKIKSVPYEIRINTDFRGVIEACAEETDDRVETWINDEIVEAYCTLHELGYVHSVECWQEGELVGGLYGVAIGGAFFGESMFSRRTDTSKVSLVHLVARLHHGGFEMLDTQFTNAHLEQFDVYEIKHQEYMERLSPILKKPCDFTFSDISEKKLVQKYFEMQDQSSSKS